MKKDDFPLLKKKLIYLDNAATTQKPHQVINAIKKYYTSQNANVHRGIYELSEQATEQYEAVREQVAKFIKADTDEIIFTKSATEASNLIAFGVQHMLQKKDIIVVSEMEHHSNLVPWQIVAENTGATIKVLPMDIDGTLQREKAEEMLKKASVVAISHVTNLGVALDIKKIASMTNGLFIVDGAQAVPHKPIDVKKIKCDAFFFSAHKMLGPTGVGVLYAKKSLLEKMKPLLYGGNMIKEVSIKESSFAEPPMKFEAGTPNVAGVIGFGVAISYLGKIGMKNIQKNQQTLSKYAIKSLATVHNIIVYNKKNESGIISFNLKGAHAHDVAALLDSYHIAVRAGHHCAMPLAKKIGYLASVRASFYLYNTKKDIDILVTALKKIEKVLCCD